MKFDDWLKTAWPHLQPTTRLETQQMRAAWNAAKREARKECVRICNSRARAVREANTYRGKVNQIAVQSSAWIDDCANEIRETIK